MKTFFIWEYVFLYKRMFFLWECFFIGKCAIYGFMHCRRGLEYADYAKQKEVLRSH